MKNLSFLIIVFFGITLSSFGQGVKPAPEDKAVVYFVRTSSAGFAINFSYFDSDQFFGLFAGRGYIRYECKPGTHLFWARSENKSFVEAEIEAGKIYFMEAVVQMGFVKAGVRLEPVDPKNAKKMKNILKVIDKKAPETMTDEEIKIEAENFKDVIERGLSKYQEEKGKGDEFGRLEKTMFYEIK